MLTTHVHAAMMYSHACAFSVVSLSCCKFTGKERDTESGLDMFGARYYGSSFGRFMTPADDSDESYGHPESWNLYAYIRNNPLRNIDPTGHACFLHAALPSCQRQEQQSCGPKGFNLDVVANRLPSRSVLLLAIGLLLVHLSVAQQSYRSYQQLSGRVLSNAQRTEKRVLASGLPLRFKGWSHQGKFRSDYTSRFSRPRAATARAELLKNAGRGADHNTRSTQFAASALPGLLLRDSLPSGFIPTSVATGDFNNDGKLDFAVANGGDNNLWLYLGKGDGTFNLPIIMPITLGLSPVWVTTADLRGIGRTDLIVAEADSNSVGVFLGNGDGTFVESSVALPGSATTLAVGDFNHDGKIDIVAPLDDENSSVYIVTLPGLGTGKFGTPLITPVAGFTPGIFSSSTSDLNGDGLPDLLLTTGNIDNIAVQVFLNKGNGTFSAGQVVAENFQPNVNTGTLLFDADGDGIVDALVADAFGILWVYHGNGDGTFNTTSPGSFSFGDFGYGIAAADVNGDGHMDVIVSGIFVNDLRAYGIEAGDQICVLQGDGKGNFGLPKVYRGDSSSYSLAVGDFNGDGHPDVVTANQDSDSVSLFLNDGLGGYGAPEGNWVGYVGGGAVNAPMSGVVTADVDGDGSTDVTFIELNQYPNNYYQLTVLLNDGKGNLSAPVRSDAIDSKYLTFGDFVLADFRNTGRPDFLAIAANYTSNGNFLSFAPNSGGGHFGPLSVTNPTNGVGILGVGDFNHDGKLDFVAAGVGIGSDPANDQGFQVFLGNGDGTFQAGYIQTFGGRLALSSAAVYVGDFNRDGKLDLLVFLEGDTFGYDVYEFFGNGDGTFQTGQLLFWQIGAMTVADLDHDGYPDIMAIPWASTTNPQPLQFAIYLGQADGSFKLTNTYAPYGYSGFLPQAPYSPNAGEYIAPMVADFNGDGNLDIANFQTNGNLNQDAFVQFMLGNGDGTFTPTYEVFDFRKPAIAAYAADLRGIGRADLFELNGYRSTYNVLQSVVAPSFQFAIVEDPIPGPKGTGIVLLDIPSSTATTISLTTSDPAITVPATISVPAGTVSKTFSFTVASGFNAKHVFSISAQLGATTAIAYGTVVASGAAGFQAQMSGPLSLPNLNLGAGQIENDIHVHLTSTNGYATSVSLQCNGLASNAQCQFTPPTMVVRQGDFSDAVMMISVGTGTPQGSYPAKLTVTDGVTSQDVPFTLNVGDFSLSLNPQVLQVFPTDQNASYSVTVGSINQFDQMLYLSCGGLPAGATCSVGYPTINVGDGLPEVIAIQTQSVPTGNYQITVTGTSAPITHSVTAQLQVSDFTASVSPTSASVTKGGSANFNVTVSPVNGFNGSVNFACSSSSGLVACSFNPTSATVPANGTATSVLTLTASSQAASEGRRGRNGIGLVGELLFGLLLPLSSLLVITRSRRKWIAFSVIALVLCGVPSCGGGGASGGGGDGGVGGGGGGGGGGAQSYSITVQVSSGTIETKSAGTIALTVN